MYERRDLLAQRFPAAFLGSRSAARAVAAARDTAGSTEQDPAEVIEG